MPGTDAGIVGILLAGGGSTRFGADKLLHPLADGTPMALASGRRLLAACPQTVSILRAGQTKLCRLLTEIGVDVRVDAACELGMGSSLACAVRATPAAAGWLVALADMPFVGASTVQSVLGALRNGAEIAAPVCRGRRGHPVGFSRGCFAALASLHGEAGGRRIIEDPARSLTLIEVDDLGVIRDIDRPGDLLAVAANVARR